MVADVRTAFAPTDPHVRQVDPWRDGRALANLLESAFRDDALDESDLRLIRALRNYGMLDALSFGLATGFVWVEGGELLANASVQRNTARKDTWIIGNVATQAAHRNRGLGRAVVEACIRYAAARGARYVALQADVTNGPALHLYHKLGFQPCGEVTHYTRRFPDRALEPIEHKAIRKARRSDRAALWALVRRNVPEAFTFAEPFDAAGYRLGFRWSLMNALNGNIEQWRVWESARRSELIGAVRTRAAITGSSHQLEILLGDSATVAEGVHLIEQGLYRLAEFVSRPIHAAQPRLAEAPHTALQMAGFRPVRTLVHMILEIEAR